MNERNGNIMPERLRPRHNRLRLRDKYEVSRFRSRVE